MLLKILSLGASALVSLGLLEMLPASERQSQDEPPPPSKKGELSPGKQGKAVTRTDEFAPEYDLRRAYNLLRRLRAVDERAVGRSNSLTHDWIERATKY